MQGANLFYIFELSTVYAKRFSYNWPWFHHIFALRHHNIFNLRLSFHVLLWQLKTALSLRGNRMKVVGFVNTLFSLIIHIK